VIQHHPNRSGSDLRGEFVRRLAHNSSILFGSWSLRQTRRGSARIGIPTDDGLLRAVVRAVVPPWHEFPEIGFRVARTR